MRIVMMGTGPFAVPTFRALLASPHDVAALVTQPQRPAKGRKAPPLSPMRETALAHQVPVFDPQSINSSEGLAWLRDTEPELLVVCDYGQILSPEALGIAPLGGINLHGSLLPKYRGAAPVHWALVRGEVLTGITVIHMTPGLDAGPILEQRQTPIDADEDGRELESRLAELGVEAVLAAIDRLAAWDRRSPLGTPQDPAQATRAPRLKKEDGHIDWTQPARAIRNRVRGLTPWPGTYALWNCGKAEPLRLLIKRVSLPPVWTSAEPGMVVRVSDQELFIQAGDGYAVAIEELQPAGKESMPIEAFLRGHRLELGEALE